MSGQPASCPLVCTDVIPVLKHYALRTKDSQSVHSIFADKICIIITHDPEMASIADTILNLSDECSICS